MTVNSVDQREMPHLIRVSTICVHSIIGMLCTVNMEIFARTLFSRK